MVFSQKARIIIPCLIILCFLSSCYKRGTYHEVEVCDDWYGPNVEKNNTFSNEPVIGDWWNVFNDPVLENYIAQSAAYNPSIKQACARILQSRALRNGAAAPLWPRIDFNTRGERLQWSENGLIPFADLATLGIPRQQNLFTLGFDALWEIDIFGKNQYQLEAAHDRLQSSIESKNDVLITVYAEVARNYFECRGLQKEIEIKKRKISLLSEQAQMVKQRKHSGLDNALDLDSIEAELARSRSELPLFEEDFYSRAFHLSALMGMIPECLLDELCKNEPLPLNPDIVPLGLRSDLLRRRPDVRRAEREWAAYNAEVRGSFAQILPSFSLFGDIGYDSTSFGKWISDGSQRWTWGGDISWPIFRGGQIRANIEANQARACEAVYAFQKVVLDALAETESAIVSYVKALEREIEQRKSEQHHKALFDLNQDQYQKGLINKTNLILAERRYLDTAETLAISETRTLVQLIALYKALGGGW